MLGGAGLFGAFPLAYAVIVDALTIPLTLMLLGLIFRGVAFEFRFKATPAHRPFWDKAFCPAHCWLPLPEGVVVGAVINGFSVTGRSYSGGALDWLTPFTLFCGVGLVIAYALLGASWLVMKSDGPLQGKMRCASKRLLLALLAVIAVISLWTPLAQPAIAARWFSLPNLFFFAPVPLLVIGLSVWLWRSLNHTHTHALPFVQTLGLVFLGFSGTGHQHLAAYYPAGYHLLAGCSTAAEPEGFMLVGALLIIPIILVYTFWSYYVFRGKVQPSVRGITDETLTSEPDMLAGINLGRQRAGAGGGQYGVSPADDGGRV